MDKIKELGIIALGSRLRRLSDRFMYDVGRIYKMQHLGFEPKWFTLASLLYDDGAMSVMDAASALKISHPAVIQFVNQMQKRGLITSEKGEKDKRKNMISLSESGRKVFESIKPVLAEMEKEILQITSSSGVDLLHIIDSIEQNLDKKDLYERVSKKLKRKMVQDVEIVPYNSGYKSFFKSLNEEWLEKYFTIEPEDIRILSDPEKIISDGGMIYFARYNNEVVGTCAALKIDNETFELAKMAVTEKAQGKQIGKRLALEVITYAEKKRAKLMVLETARKLTAAVNLYEKLGFEYIPFKQKSKYQRTTVKMQLMLK